MNRRAVVSIVSLSALMILSACGGGGGNSTPPPSNPPSTTLSISTTAIPDGVVGKPYTATLTVTGGTTPYTWSASEPLPQGLTLNSNGTISGTPTTEWSNYTLFSVSDASSPVKTASVALAVRVAQELLISTTNLPAAHANASYGAVVQANTPTVSKWTISSGQLPPGIQLANASSIQVELSGMCTQPGTYNFTVQATSTNTPPQIVSQSFALEVDSRAAISTAQLPDVIMNVPYSASLSAVNGTPPYHFSVLPPGLPPGLSLSDSGQISGTFVDGQWSYAVEFQVSDSAATPSATSTILPMNVVDQLSISQPPTTAYLNQMYWGSLSAYGGRMPYKLMFVSGNLPPGINFDVANGYLTGTPTQLGDFTFTVGATDSTNPPQSAQITITLSVVPSILGITPSLPAQIPQGAAFNGSLAAYGGTPPYVWTIASGSLPTGLQLDSSTGAVTGVPASLGDFTFQARVTDSGSPSQSADWTYTMKVVGALGRNDTLQKATSIGNGNVFASISPYSDPVYVANPDVDYYRIRVAEGSAVNVNILAKRGNTYNPLDSVIEFMDENGARLNNCNQPDNPTGIFVSACLNDDVVAGVDRDSSLALKLPGTPGTLRTVYLRVFDWGGSARPDMTYTLYLNGAVDTLTIPPHYFWSGQVGVNYSYQLSSQGGFGTVTWSLISGALPSGLTMSASGLISGTPTTAGTYTFGMQAADSAIPPQTATAAYSITVNR